MPLPVISVGNLTLGGTGKTPVLIRLASDLYAQGRRPAILSRGYGQDEIALMKEKCVGTPIAANPDRAKAAQVLLASKQVDTFLLDDGFQHWPLRRNMDIVCVDASAPLESERLLPAGRLREPWSALKRANVVVLTRVELISAERLAQVKKFIESRLRGGVLVVANFAKHLVDAELNRPLEWQWIRGKSVIALSAIGNPAAFEANLAREGAVVTPYRFRDHFAYRQSDLAKVRARALEKKALIVTTEKDWIKLKRWAPEMLVVRLDVSFSGDAAAAWTAAVNKGLS